MPSKLVSEVIGASRVGLDAIVTLGDHAECSLTASAIRAAECCDYPMAIIASIGDQVAYAFLSDSFKKLDKLTFLGKGAPLPASFTREFNRNPDNVASGQPYAGKPRLLTGSLALAISP